LGYGHHVSSLEAFLGSMGSVTSPETARHRASELVAGGFAYRPSYTLTPGQPTPGMTYPPASPHRYPPPEGSVRPRRASPLAFRTWIGRGHGGTGISTRCASTTPFGLALAPDLPWADEPSPGTLGHSAEGFFPPLSLLMPAFALDHAPQPFTRPLHSRDRRSPTHPLAKMTQLRLRA
jgi:hypothetical protein